LCRVSGQNLNSYLSIYFSFGCWRDVLEEKICH